MPLDADVASVIQVYLLAERLESAAVRLSLVAKGPNRGQPLSEAGLRTVFRYHRGLTGIYGGLDLTIDLGQRIGPALDLLMRHRSSAGLMHRLIRGSPNSAFTALSQTVLLSSNATPDADLATAFATHDCVGLNRRL